MDFKDKVAIVTGGGNGIGRAVCLGFAGRMARRSWWWTATRDGAAAVAAEIGRQAIACTADVSRTADVQAYVARALDAFGRIDCFHNNAGIEGRVAPTAEYDEGMFDAIMGVNVKGVFLGLRHVLPVMIRQGRRHRRQHGLDRRADRHAGHAGLCRVQARRHRADQGGGQRGRAARRTRERGLPGADRDAHDRGHRKARCRPTILDSVEERYTAGLPLRRYGTADEVANVVLFLCSGLSGKRERARSTSWMAGARRRRRAERRWGGSRFEGWRGPALQATPPKGRGPLETITWAWAPSIAVQGPVGPWWGGPERQGPFGFRPHPPPAHPDHPAPSPTPARPWPRRAARRVRPRSTIAPRSSSQPSIRRARPSDRLP